VGSRPVRARATREGETIGWSLKIGRLFGADVRIHWLFLAMVLVFALQDLFDPDLADARFTYMALTLSVMGVVFVSVFLHEVGHTIAGIRAGGRAEQILIWPLGGLAELHGVPPFPSPQIRVAFSGPLINLVLATALLGVLVILEIPVLAMPFLTTHGFGGAVLACAFWGNLFLFGFNLLPAFPLDGGSICRWGLAMRRPDRGLNWATGVTVTTGKVVAILLGIAGLALFVTVHKFVLLVVLAGFIYLASEREKRMLEYASMAPTGGEYGLPIPAETEPAPPPRPGFWARRRERRRARKREREVRKEVELRKRVDVLLDKIAKEGLNALSEKEKAFLKEASKKYQRNGASR
jgi:Zn-dependent protease